MDEYRGVFISNILCVDFNGKLYVRIQMEVLCADFSGKFYARIYM